MEIIKIIMFIIRLSNSIGPPITNTYKKSHWISICNKFSYQLFNMEKY